MKPSRHATPFREGDRVTYITIKPGNETVVGTFLGYCRGFLSHCMVRWDGGKQDARVAAHKLRLVERPTPEV